MSKVKTAELADSALDCAVAMCGNVKFHVEQSIVYLTNENGNRRNFNPSSNWAWGGSIIERMLSAGLILQALPTAPGWTASVDSPNRFVHGPTALVAAMRCYVSSVLGVEVDVPDEFNL